MATDDDARPVSRGATLVVRYGSVAAARRATHPDTRTDARLTDDDFVAVQAYTEALAAGIIDPQMVLFGEPPVSAPRRRHPRRRRASPPSSPLAGTALERDLDRVALREILAAGDAHLYAQAIAFTCAVAIVGFDDDSSGEDFGAARDHDNEIDSHARLLESALLDTAIAHMRAHGWRRRPH